MEKATDKWFKDHGWSEKKYADGTHIIYTLTKNNKQYARFDHHRDTNPDWRGKLHTYNWYEFFCCGNGFKVENRIFYRRMTVEQVESALKVVGLLW